jgi:hypothetical protein
MRYYISEGRVEEVEENTGRVPGDYTIAHATINFVEIPAKQPCLVLRKGDEKLCVLYKNMRIGEVVATNLSQAVSFTKATVELIWQMMQGFDEALVNIPVGFQLNVREIREELKEE